MTMNKDSYTEIEYGPLRSYRHYGENVFRRGDWVDGHMFWQYVKPAQVPESILRSFAGEADPTAKALNQEFVTAL